MIIFRADLPLLKRGINIFLATLVLAIMTVLSSRNFVAQARLDFQDAGHKKTEAQNRLDLALQDEQVRSTYAAEYAELLGRKIIGNGLQPNLAQDLERFRNRSLVIDFNYAISPQQPYKLPFPFEYGNYDLRQNRMSIRLDLLHEGQLLAFLAALKTAEGGRFFPDNCSIERIRNDPAATSASSPVATKHRRQPELHAECSGRWLTISSRTAP